MAVSFDRVDSEAEDRTAERERLDDAARDQGRLSQALRDTEDRLRDTLSAAEVGTWEWNIAEDNVQWSANIEQIFALPSGAFAGTYQAWLALVHPDDREFVSGKVAEAISSKGSYEVEFRFRRPDGSTGWQSARGSVVVDDSGRPRLLRGIVLDVSARRFAEDALKLQAQVLENISEGVSVCDERGIIRYTNPAQDRIFGYARGELISKSVGVLSAESTEERERIEAEVRAELETTGRASR